jgi:hypothetical protein
MKLQHELSKILEDELTKEFDKEVNNADYKPQHLYADCNERANDLLSGAFDRVTKTLTLAIIKHREEAHEENRADERKLIESEMVAEDKATAVAYKWWLN